MGVADESPRARVLVVDDEPAIARIIARALAAHFDVTVTTSSADALARLKRGETYEAVTSDIAMPGMTGLELHAQLRAVRPDIAERFVFVSGSLDLVASLLAKLSNPTLPKPFEPSALRATVSEMCARSKAVAVERAS